MGPKENGFSGKDEKTSDPQEKTEFFIGDTRHDDEEPEPLPGYVVPPDGGWGWVIVAASFFCNLVVDGIIFSFGIIMNHLVVSFNESTSRVALVGSLLSGFYLLMGPFVSALANKFGFRAVAVAGSIIGCIGFVASSFATSIEFLCITYGVIGGIGFGLVYVPAVIAVGFYFEKKRALATGIAVCGSGIGTFVMAPFTSYLINEYGWRGALLIQAGLVLNCAVFGALFRPLQPTRGEPEPEELGTPLLHRIKRARDEKMRQCDSVASFHSGQIIQRLRTDSRCSGSDTPVVTVFNGGNRQMSAVSVNQFEPIPENGEPPSDTLLPMPNIHISPSEAVIYENGDDECGESREQSGSFLRNESRVSVANSMVSRRSSRGSRTNLDGARPMYRDDIFYSASLLRLPQYTAQDSSKYHASVTRLPTPIPEDDENEPCGCCKCLPLESRHVLARMTHVDLLTSPSFITISVSSFLTLMGFFVPFMYLTNKAVLSNPEMSREDASLLISVIGIANTVGRVACGALADHPKVNSLLVNNVALSIGGAVTILCPLFHSFSLLIVYAVLFGISISAFASLRSILLVELLGLEKLTNAFGLLLLFSGIAATAGGPIAGKFYDATADYDASFYFSGTLLLLSGVICYPLAAINRWEKRKMAEKCEA